MTTLGKIIGDGFPVGAVAGRADVMAVFDPTRGGAAAGAAWRDVQRQPGDDGGGTGRGAAPDARRLRPARRPRGQAAREPGRLLQAVWHPGPRDGSGLAVPPAPDGPRADRLSEHAGDP